MLIDYVVQFLQFLCHSALASELDISYFIAYIL